MRTNNSSSDVNQGSISVQHWPPYSRRLPMGTPLKNIFQTPMMFDSFSEAQKTKLRKHVAATVPTMPCAELDQFLCDVFAQDDVLTAYFRPTDLNLPAKTGPALKTILPFEIALAAGKRAGAMPVLLPHERRLAILAALVYPCATFYAADPSLRRAASTRGRNSHDDLANLRRMLLEAPLRELRRTNNVMAYTLGAAVGVRGADDCEPQQVARLVSSIKLATVGLDQMWRGVPRQCG